MTFPFSRFASLTTLLYAYVIAGPIIRGGYDVMRLEFPEGLGFLYGLGFAWIMAEWLKADCRKRGIGWVLDLGMFVYIVWPLIMAYHLIKTRRAKGLLVIMGFGVAYLGAWTVGSVMALWSEFSH